MKAVILRYKLEFFLLAIFGLIFLGFVVALLLGQHQKPAPAPQPEKLPLIPKGIINESNFSSFGRTEIGKTTEQELKNFSDLREKAPEKPGTHEFVSDSAFVYRDNAIITENSVAAFKRIVPVNPENWSSPQISYYQQIYGSPQAIYTGSKTYGSFMETHIYTDKGLALITNPFTGEVFEIQSFAPTTIEEYLQRWGNDIKDYSKEPVEGP